MERGSVDRVGGDVTRRDLGGGLALRWTGPADAERVAEFTAYAFRNAPEDPPLAGLGAQVRDWMSGRHPLVGPEDFVIVEDTATGAIVASSCLMRQEWEYDGIPFDVGRPEFVVTDEGYRNRGLIRAIFTAIHERGAARDQLVQGITGIPYFYRQFGYEYALDLEGGRGAYFATIPDAPAAEPEPYALREATPDDLPFIMALYDRRRAGLLVSTRVPGDFWRATFSAPRDAYNMHWCLYVIVDAAGAPRGYIRVSSKRWGENLWVWDWATEDGVALRATGAPILRALRELAKRTPHATGDDKPVTGIWLALHREHPLYAALGEAVAPRTIAPYAWYVRVPDLPGFLRHIAPALERRLATSAMAGHTGDLRIDFYRGGLRLTFADGRLTGAEPWRRPVWGERQGAGFPPLVFLQLLFGHRSLAELRAAFPDVLANDEATPLLDALFPKRVSWVPYPE